MRSNREHDRKHLDHNPATFLACFYGHQTASISFCNRPHDLPCASSIAAADWDTHQVASTTKTSRVHKPCGDRFAG